jgi:hypothetical protein
LKIVWSKFGENLDLAVSEACVNFFQISPKFVLSLSNFFEFTLEVSPNSTDALIIG